MNRSRHFAIVFSFFAVFAGFGPAAANAQTTNPQIAKVTAETSPKTAEKEPAAAAETEPSISFSNSTPAAPSLSRVGVQNTQTMPITLNEAIAKALQNNNDIEVAKNDVRIAESSLRSLLGFYDGEFTINPNYNRNSTTGQGATNDLSVNSDFTKFVKPGGGNYRVFLNNSRTENRFAQQQVSSGAATSSSGAIYSSSLGVSFTQPLMRNFSTDATRRQIKIQRKRISQSDADFRRQAIQVIAQVQQAYWDLVFALRDQQNRVANLNLSKENLRQVEAKIQAGAAAPLQKAEVETELANRESELLVAVQQVSTAENRLKQLFLKDPSASEWTMQMVPTDAPVIGSDAIDLQLAMKDAMEFRPELSRLRLEKEVNKIDIDYFKNQTKPRIDLVSTVSLDGLALGKVNTENFTIPTFAPNDGSISGYLYNLICPAGGATNATCLNNPIPTTTIFGSPNYLNGGYGRSFRNLFRSDAPNFTVGVTINFPLRNKAAKADLATARFQSERIDAQTRSQEQAVIAEVRNAVQAVETARQRIETARRARANAEIQLQGERKLFEVGKTTTFFLFQRENTLTNARNAEIRAETDYNKALSELQRVTSTTFRANNIEVDSPTDDK
jgi:outer membrane protein